MQEYLEDFKFILFKKELTEGDRSKIDFFLNAFEQALNDRNQKEYNEEIEKKYQSYEKVINLAFRTNAAGCEYLVNKYTQLYEKLEKENNDKNDKIRKLYNQNNGSNGFMSASFIVCLTILFGFILAVIIKYIK